MALRDFYSQFLDLWAKLTLLQRVGIGFSALAVTVLVTALVIWANKPVYKALYTNMNEEDLREVSERLTKQSITYKIVKDKDGSKIEVPQNVVYNTRMMLAQEGLPKTKNTGFELFDDAKFGMTEQMQNVNYQRALQGELATTIASMNEIAEARVLITVPKDSLFVTEDEAAKASVVLKFMPNVTFSQSQIKAISHLVSAAVKGLKPENVQVVDTAGNLLSEFLTENNQPFLLTQTQMEQQRAEERRMESSLRDLLSRIVGDGKFVAKVSLQMDFNKRETVSEQYGETPVTRSEHALEINSKNTGRGPAGIPGVESNLAEPDILIDNTISEYNKTEETRNYEIDKTVTREEKTGGDIKRISVSVVLDHQEVSVVTDGTSAVERRARTDEDLSKIRANIAAAVGLDIARGDIIDVSNISFDTADSASSVGTKLAALREKNMEIILAASKYATAIIIIILFYFLIIRPILKRLDHAREIDDDMLGESALDAQLSGLDLAIGGDSGFPKTVEELEREIEAELEGAAPLDVEAVKSKVMLKKIEEQANEDPESVANLLKAFIKGN